jgi:hypothetical protein
MSSFTARRRSATRSPTSAIRRRFISSPWPIPSRSSTAVKNLAALAAPQDAAPKPRDFLGHKIYSIAQRGKAQPDGSTAAPAYLYLSDQQAAIWPSAKARPCWRNTSAAPTAS